MNTLSEWVEASPHRRRLLAEESLILEASEEIWAALARRGIQKQDLAATLGCSKAHVTQLLNGSRNMTLRTLADIALALNQECHIEFRDAAHDGAWATSCFEISPARRRTIAEYSFDAANDGVQICVLEGAGNAA